MTPTRKSWRTLYLRIKFDNRKIDIETKGNYK